MNYAERNGGDTTRFGGGRVLLFLHRTARRYRWQARCYQPDCCGCTACGAGDTPREAYAQLMGVLKGDGVQRLSERMVDLLCGLSAWQAIALNPRNEKA
jgi:hypothetical protein